MRTIEVPLTEVVSIEKINWKEFQGARTVGKNWVVKGHEKLGRYHDLGTHRKHLVLISARKQYVISCREPETLAALVKEAE